MAEGTVITYEPHAKQAAVHASNARFRVVVAGRQSGKTLTGVAEISSWVLERAPGNYWWTTASYKTTDKAWRDLLAFLPKHIIKSTNQTKNYISFHSGSRISIRSADAPESLVSETLDGEINDEFAQWKPDVWPQLLGPMLGVTQGPALFLGSPRGRNYAYDLYIRGLGEDPLWQSFKWASNESPYFSAEDFERARRELPERIFRQEYLADFVEGGGEVFRNVTTAIGPSLAKADAYTVLGVDLAKVRDWTVLWALNSSGETVEVQRFQHMDWSVQRLKIVEAYQRLGCKKAVIDATGVGDPIVEELDRSGVRVEPIKFTSQSKAQLIEALMLRFDSGSIQLPPGRDDLIEEIKAFAFETMPSGRDRYSAPEGRHDDAVIALALAAWGIRQYAGKTFKKAEPRNLIVERGRESASRIAIDPETGRQYDTDVRRRYHERLGDEYARRQRGDRS